jgi:hypothetical protein
MMLGVTTWLGCGGPVEGGAVVDAAEIDVPEIDAPDASVDGPVDAPDAAPATSVLDLTSAAGRMQGGTLTLDFEIGHVIDQGGATGGAFTLDVGATLP